MSPGGVWTRLPLVQLNVQLWDFTEFGEYGLENNSQMKERCIGRGGKAVGPIDTNRKLSIGEPLFGLR